MQKNLSRFLKVANHILTLSSAAIMIVALILAVVVHPAQATPPQNPPQLNLSHIACVDGEGKVEIHFVLLNVPAGVTPGDLTFKVSVNGGASVTHTISYSKVTGNVYHYSYYEATNGTFNVTEASVSVGSETITLHNPGVYADYKSCVVTPPACEDGETLVEGECVVTPPTCEDGETLVEGECVVTPPTCEDGETLVEGECVVTPPTCDDGETLVEGECVVTPPTCEDGETLVEGECVVTPPTCEDGETLVEGECVVTPPTCEDGETLVEGECVVTPPTCEEGETLVDGECTTPKNPPHNTPDPVKLKVDPYCTSSSEMQWTVINPNAKPFVIDYFTIDGGAHQPGFSVPTGEHPIATTTLGTHTLVVYFGESQKTSLTYTIEVCPFTQPPVVDDVSLLIPVTGADLSGNLTSGFAFAGITLAGLSMVLAALRKFLHL